MITQCKSRRPCIPFRLVWANVNGLRYVGLVLDDGDYALAFLIPDLTVIIATIETVISAIHQVKQLAAQVEKGGE